MVGNVLPQRTRYDHDNEEMAGETIVSDSSQMFSMLCTKAPQHKRAQITQLCMGLLGQIQAKS